MKGKKAKSQSMLGKTLDAFVDARELTVAEVARRAGVDQGGLSRMRSGENRTSPETIQRIITALFPVTPDERDALYVAAGHIPPTWQMPSLKRLLSNAGYDPKEATR